MVNEDKKGDFVMNILKKVIKIIGVMSVVFVTYILLQRPDIASAAEQDVSGTQEI